MDSKWETIRQFLTDSSMLGQLRRCWGNAGRYLALCYKGWMSMWNKTQIMRNTWPIIRIVCKNVPLTGGIWNCLCIFFIHLKFNRIMCFNPFTAKLFNLNFHPCTWSCVSLTRSTTSSEWKLFRFDILEVNSFQILLVDVTFYIWHI